MTLALDVIDAGPPIVTLKDVCVDRGGRTVLHRLTCDFPRGKTSAIIGLNGSGKSTLLRTLLGELPYRGEIRFACGEDHRRPRPDHVGYVPQRLNIDATMPITVRDLVGLAMQKTPILFGVRRKVLARIEPMLRRVGVWERIDVPVEGLSGGQLQRVLLALALEPQPEVLLLDEPASGIDFKDQDAFYELIAGIQHETGVTVLLVSHDLPMVAKHAHRVYCLRGGVVAAAGAPADLLTPESLARLFAPGMALTHAG